MPKLPGAADLTRISTILHKLSERADRTTDAVPHNRDATPLATTPPLTVRATLTMRADSDLAVIESLFGERRRRDAVFARRGAGLGEPSWDFLLYLYIGTIRGWAVSVSHLAQVSNVPQTSALRHIHRLEMSGLVKRQTDAFDRRKVLVALTTEAIDLVGGYAATLRRDPSIT